MKFSLGDRVLLKRTGDEGIITAFLSKDLIEVEIGDIRFPVYADEIDHPYLKWFTDPKKPMLVRRAAEIPVEKETARKSRLSRGIYLSFLPQFAPNTSDDIIESFSIHLLNETADHLAFAYDARTAKGANILHLHGTLHPFANIFLHTLALEELNAQPRFHWSVAPKEKQNTGVKAVLRIRPTQLIRYINTLLQEGEPSFSILLTQDAEAIPVASPISVPGVVKSESDSQSRIELHTEAVPVLDLHLADDNSVEDLLNIQLSLLERKLNAAYATGQNTMLVIHGIGSGKLRNAVHELLKQTPFVSRYSNHWMAAYGWGATEVYFATGT